MDTITIETALEQWHAKNDDGAGYAIGTEQDTAAGAAAAEGWTIVARGTEGKVLCRTTDGGLALVCNANGPWVCNIDEA